MKASLFFLSFLFISHANATFTVFLKDPNSSDIGAGAISSGPIGIDTDANWITPETLFPAIKGKGIIGWGGSENLWEFSLVDEVFEKMKANISAEEIEAYILKRKPAGHGYFSLYRIGFINATGAILGGVSPSCDGSENCRVRFDPIRRILIHAGNQEAGVIENSFKAIQKLYDIRKSTGSKSPLHCFIANALSVTQIYGGEVIPLKGSSVSVDLKSQKDILRFYSSADQEDQIIPNLINKMELSGFDCH